MNLYQRDGKTTKYFTCQLKERWNQSDGGIFIMQQDNNPKHTANTSVHQGKEVEGFRLATSIKI